MSSTLRLLVFIVVTALALPCSAQLVAADSDIAKCLVKPEQPLVYPEDAYLKNSSGVVTLELEFKNGGSEPNVNVVAATGHWQLKEAVKEYVRGYRLPCAPAGTVTQLRQEFQFFPNDGRKVSQSELRDLDREREERLLKCVVPPPSKLTYPGRTIRTSGKVMLRVVFEAPDASPKVEVTDPGIDRRFARAAAEWAEGYRLPCHDGGKPVSAEQLFHFMSEADDGLTAVLQDTDLFTFLRSVKDIRQQKKYLDLNQMGCPFELRLRYLQPHMANEILEPGTPVPERKLLIEWLATLQLNTNGREQQNQLLGQAVTLAVPCGKIDL